MSILVLERILRDIHIDLEEMEKKMLYDDLIRCFGIIGSYRECDRLEEFWKDPAYRKAIEQYIKAWLEFRKKRKVVEVYA
ncbi:MAG: hypothetical protein H3Z52_02100 [archaeon]|nr:hypothetical protein [archaeon]MCP8318149.1 hypothetical protein [archaeon]MCP8319721.1 hypothetical protein [archaeon]